MSSNISEPFIHRPVATTLLLVAVALAGGVAFQILPVAPLPQVDFPTVQVNAQLPGASPETMASSVATPLERQFGHIAAVTEMTSSSSLSNTSITLQFDLNRNIDAAARDVEAAINAARGYLPTNLPSNPTYRKVNPTDSPIFRFALTSDVMTQGQMYDAAYSIMGQKLSQVPGVGQVNVGGSALPGVRIELNPMQLNKYGIGLEQVRTAIGAQNANTPKGYLADRTRTYELGVNDQMFTAAEYAPLIIGYNNGSPVRVSDVGEAVDAVEDLRNAGYSNAKRSIVVTIFRQPGANIIQTVDGIRAALPQLEAAIPHAIVTTVMDDQTVTIRASVKNVEETMLISMVLVVMVVFVFLRNVRSTFIPGVAVPVSLIGTFGVMYLAGFTLDNLSLMALTISTGFVVDDAIVVIENISRYLEQGIPPMRAALKGAGEIGFTVLTISISLIAVFIPLLLMGGLVGRLFREFSITLSVAIAMSMLVSLTATPMMCAHLLKEQKEHGWLYRATERIFNGMVNLYGRTLTAALRFAPITLFILLCAIGLNVYLFIHVPKGFFPQEDTGRLNFSIQADQDTSFQAMNGILQQSVHIILSDPGVGSVQTYTGGGVVSQARGFIVLKPLAERKISADEVISRLRPRLSRVRGAYLYMQNTQDVRVGGRQSNAQYQYTMRSDNLADLDDFAPKMLEAVKKIPIIADVSSDQLNRGLESYVAYDRSTAARFGISSELIDNVLYDAFGQRQVSTMYKTLNQYHVVEEVAPQYWQNPLSLRDIWVAAPSGQEVPLSAFAHWANDTAPIAVAHQGLFPAVTISFNLLPGVALGDAVDAINKLATDVGQPASIQSGFAGTAQTYQDSLRNEPILIAAALISVYIVLGILYESYIHPITILTTLPSAGVGAQLALLVTNTELSLIAVIGMILLIGIVKKNAIMMIDFALAAERLEGKNSRDSIFEACLLRFRPIMMTTMAALLGAVPLALGRGIGAELRRPLGITIIGGLLVSQALTLYTTPVVYLYFDRLQHWIRSRRRASEMALSGAYD
jgi:multidrug efflux pump